MYIGLELSRTGISKLQTWADSTSQSSSLGSHNLWRGGDTSNEIYSYLSLGQLQKQGYLFIHFI